MLNDRVYDTNVGKTGTSLDRIRKSFFGLFETYVNESSPFKAGSKERSFWMTTGFDIQYFNQAVLFDSNTEVLEELVGNLRDLKVLHSVLLGGSALIHAEILRKRGYVVQAAVPLMAYALDPAIDTHKVRSGLEIKKVETESDLAIAEALAAEGFGMTPELAHNYMSPVFGNPKVNRYYLVDDGIPVSTSLFIQNGKFIGCFDVATPERFQRKGYGEELMKGMFAIHAAAGAELVVLQATTAGEVLYRRLGYQVLEHTQNWAMLDKALW
jgi:hypothetical protein